MLSRSHPLADRVRRTAAIAALGASAFALSAAPADAAVSANHTIDAFYGSNFVTMTGYADGSTITVTRNGVTIANATGDANVIDGELTTELNHEGESCFTDRTPDLLPGDVINVSDGTVTDSMTVGNIFLDVANMSLNGRTLSYTGRGVQGVSYPLNIRFIGLPSGGGRDLATTTPAAGPGGAIAGSVQLAQNQADAWDPSVSEADISTTGADGGVTHSDGEADDALAPCPPLWRSEVTNTPASTISGVAGSSSTIQGVNATGITAQVSRVGGGNIGAVKPAGANWSQAITAADLPTEGAHTIRVTYIGDGAPPAQDFVVTKDTVAPGAVTASPAAGTYTTAQTVTFTPEQGGTVRWTNDGSDPTQASATGPVTVSQSQTIKARQYDAAGNPGPVGTFAYTIAAAQQQQQSQQQQAPQQQLPVVKNPTAPVVTLAPRASSVSTASSQKLASVRKSGLKYKVNLANGTRFVRVRLVKVSGGKRTRVKQSVLQVSQAGSYTGRLRGLKRLKAGRYQLQVAAAGADRAYSTAATKSLRIKR